MAADAGRRVEVANLLSLGDDLIGVLLDTKDGESLAQAGEGALMLRSACRSDSGDLELQVKGPFSPSLLRFGFMSCSEPLVC
jgi:hypothetical protein